MKRNYLMRVLLLMLIAMIPFGVEARINMGTINLQVGETEEVYAEPSTYYTVSGSWSRTGGNAFYISARSQRSCQITAINVGTATLEWEGLINTTWAEMYWTVIVSPEPNNDKTGKCGDNLTYTFKDATKALTISGTGKMYDYGNGELPWLDFRDEIKKVVIESGVTSIGNYAFSNTKDIDVSMSNSVTTIGDHAFERSAITKINIGSGVTSIGIRAFAICSELSKISIPDNVVAIGSFAFAECTSVTSLELGKKVTTIDNGAFSKCSNISSLFIPDNTSTIGDYAFSRCSGLKTVNIGKGITSISPYAFVFCDNITNVSIHCEEIGYFWFNGVKSIKEIIIGDEVKSIGGTEYHDGVFEGYSNLEKVTIGSNVEHIGTRTFGKCSSLSTLIIPNSVKSIGQQAFWGCSGLTSIVLPNGIISIERNLFDGCSNLASLSIPNTVTAIDVYAFAGCSGLKEVRSYINNPFAISTLCFIFKKPAIG